MDCTTARDQLLTAEPSELRGTGDGSLALHLRECGECRAIAARVREGTDRLATDLIPPASPVGPTPLGLPDSRESRRLGLVRRLGWLAAAASVSAAAALVLVLRAPAPRSDSARLVSEPIAAPSITPAVIGPAVSVPPGSNAILFKTKNPMITVIWYY